MNDEPNSPESATENERADAVLSEDEVNALVSGVENGEIEVHSAAGPRYAVVRDFEIPRRSRIVSDSLPRLDLLNAKLAERLKVRSEQVLAADLSVEFIKTDRVQFGELVEDDVARLMAIEYAAPPLPGNAAVLLDGSLVNRLVELFFGGAGNEQRNDAHGAFTAGVMRVIDAYSKVVLDAVRVTWSNVIDMEPQPQKTESSLSLLSIADESDLVVRSVFEYSFAGRSGALTLLLPEKFIASLEPAFKGDNRTQDVEQDELWSKTIRDCLPDISVDLSSTVGQATMTLGELICLEPGDIISIADPADATILANNVRLMRGRFGVHAGHNAVAASRWLTSDITNTDKDIAHGQ